MSERVTDEWLKDAARAAMVKAISAYSPTATNCYRETDFCLAFAQSIAWECVRLLNDMQDENVETDYYTPTDCADAIRARFGLED